jgi:hypothetical protein
MFASRSLTEHLLRGASGIAALALALQLMPQHPWAMVPLLALALLALRGCPMCWTLGLVETVVAKVRGKPSSGCSDGSCAPRQEKPRPSQKVTHQRTGRDLTGAGDHADSRAGPGSGRR